MLLFCSGGLLVARRTRVRGWVFLVAGGTHAPPVPAAVTRSRGGLPHLRSHSRLTTATWTLCLGPRPPLLQTAGEASVESGRASAGLGRPPRSEPGRTAPQHDSRPATIAWGRRQTWRVRGTVPTMRRALLLRICLAKADPVQGFDLDCCTLLRRPGPRSEPAFAALGALCPRRADHEADPEDDAMLRAGRDHRRREVQSIHDPCPLSMSDRRARPAHRRVGHLAGRRLDTAAGRRDHAARWFAKEWCLPAPGPAPPGPLG